MATIEASKQKKTTVAKEVMPSGAAVANVVSAAPSVVAVAKVVSAPSAAPSVVAVAKVVSAPSAAPSSSVSKKTSKESKSEVIDSTVKTSEAMKGGDVGGIVEDMSNVSITDVASDVVISKKRTFKICRENGAFSSRLIGKTPKQAANKALTALLREARSKAKDSGQNMDENSIFKAEFTIRETTRRSKGKEYSYIGTRERLSEPSVYTIMDGDNVKEIVNNYKNKVVKLVPEVVVSA